MWPPTPTSSRTGPRRPGHHPGIHHRRCRVVRGQAGNTVNDIVIIDDFHFRLRAERSGVGTGRTYTITYQVTDVGGSTTIASTVVTVPAGAVRSVGGLEQAEVTPLQARQVDREEEDLGTWKR
jgi:hypothetical protein